MLASESTSFSDGDSDEVVLTPTRLRQPLKDVPASVTVLTGDLLKKQGITSIAEAMRLVPGMVVLDGGGHDYRVSYHGTNAIFPRRMQLLIDGISWYRSGFAFIPWETLPVSIDEIHRIEVTRSPSTPTYGANSFFSVINIITKHPDDYANRIHATATGGTQSTKNAFVRYAHRAAGSSTALEASFAHKQDTGYDSDSSGTPRHDSSRVDIARFTTVTELNAGTSLTTHFGATDADLEDQFGDARQISFPDIQERTQFGEVLLSHDISPMNRIDLRFYATHLDRKRGWRTCVPTIMFSDELRALNTANPTYVQALLAGEMPSGGSAQDDALLTATLTKIAQLGPTALADTCGSVNEDIEEYRYDVELQNTIAFNDTLRAVLGAALRYDSSESETLYDGKVSVNSQRLFSNVEWKPARAVVVNVGAALDRDDSVLEDTHVSPRIGANFHLTPNQTLRLGYSQAIRTPDTLAEEGNWGYIARDLQPLYEGQTERQYYVKSQMEGGLDPERIEAYEVGYYFSHHPHGVLGDIRIFHEKLTDLMSEKPQLSNFTPTNNNSVDLNGAELELRASLTPQLDAYLTYARINNNATTYYEETLHANSVGSLALSYAWSQYLTASGAYYRSSQIAGADYERYDFTVRKRWGSLNGVETAMTFAFKYSPSTEVNVWRDASEFRSNRYDDKWRAFLTLELSAL